MGAGSARASGAGPACRPAGGTASAARRRSARHGRPPPPALRRAPQHLPLAGWQRLHIFTATCQLGRHHLARACFLSRPLERPIQQTTPPPVDPSTLLAAIPSAVLALDPELRFTLRQRGRRAAAVGELDRAGAPLARGSPGPARDVTRPGPPGTGGGSVDIRLWPGTCVGPRRDGPGRQPHRHDPRAAGPRPGRAASLLGRRGGSTQQLPAGARCARSPASPRRWRTRSRTRCRASGVPPSSSSSVVPRGGPGADPADLRRDRPDLRAGRPHGGVRRPGQPRAPAGQHPPGAGARAPGRGRPASPARSASSSSTTPRCRDVEGDRDRLVQVFLNLVKNAAEAVPAQGGQITVVDPVPARPAGRRRQQPRAAGAADHGRDPRQRPGRAAPTCSTTCSSRSSPPSATARAWACRWWPRSWPTTQGAVSYVPGDPGAVFRVRLPAARRQQRAGCSGGRPHDRREGPDRRGRRRHPHGRQPGAVAPGLRGAGDQRREPLWRWIAAGEGDVVITDVALPDENSLDLLPRIRTLAAGPAGHRDERAEHAAHRRPGGRAGRLRVPAEAVRHRQSRRRRPALAQLAAPHRRPRPSPACRRSSCRSSAARRRCRRSTASSPG